MFYLIDLGCKQLHLMGKMQPKLVKEYKDLFLSPASKLHALKPAVRKRCLGTKVPGFFEEEKKEEKRRKTKTRKKRKSFAPKKKTH